ncbi:O-antigen polymerase [Rheinheimera sp.]|uniref:O-antigen polymerase n=1 Tax=Rheinheimera sp. TaxID=1869214 RepID=UPI00307E3564
MQRVGVTLESVLLILAVISLCYPVLFYLHNSHFEFAFSFAGNYFIILPLFYLIAFSRIPITFDFSDTIISTIYVGRDFSSILAMLFYWLVLNQIMFNSRNLSFHNKLFSRGGQFDFNLSFKFFLIFEILAFYLYTASGLDAGDAHWARSKELYIEEAGTSAVITLFLVAGFRYITVCLLFLNVWSNYRVIQSFVCIILLCVTDTYTTGNRITLLVFLFMLFVFLLRSRHYKAILFSALAMIPLGFFMTIFRVLRSQLHSEDSAIDGFIKGWDLAVNNIDFNEDIVFESMSGITESINFNVLVNIFSIFGNEQSHMLGLSYFKTLVWWIPRSIYPDKPESITVEVAGVFAPYADVALITTAVGESFINFGYFGMVLLPILFVFFKSVVSFFIENEILRQLVYMCFGFLMFRMAYSDTFIYFMFGCAAYIFLSAKYKVKSS